MLLVTTWFGTFLLEDHAVVEKRLFPQEPAALAARLAEVEDWKVLNEERELLAKAEEVFVVEPRLERAGGKFTAERPPFLDAEDFGYSRALLHAAMVELAKRQIRKAVGTEDHLRQAVEALDDLQDQENLLLERLREWYGLHFPELARTVDAETYLELIATHGQRQAMPIDHRDSVGADLGEAEEQEIRETARLAQAVGERRAGIEAYVERTIRGLAPNTAELAGPVLAARLVSLAGSLEALARAPAGTIQVLGAERALFRHLRTGARPPKHGVLFQHPIVHQAPPWQRGAIARLLASKIAMAARADAYTHRTIRDTLKEDLERGLRQIRQKKREKPLRRTAKGGKQTRHRRRETF